VFALFNNMSFPLPQGAGDNNTADGFDALFNNTSGDGNTAMGAAALFNNTVGNGNTAIGAGSLGNTTGSGNTAIGTAALVNSFVGSSNIGVGAGAGTNVTAASNVICIGAPGQDVANSCYIGQIFAATSTQGTAVFIDSDGKLGTATSSRRFKDGIRRTGSASEVLFALKPVTFHYKKEIDPQGTSQFGLVAEEVEKVNPDLVVCDKEGKPYSVRYDQVNAMLLNEFLKEHKRVEEQQSKIERQQARIAELKSTVAQQQKSFQSKLAKEEEQIAVLALGLQKVSAQLEINERSSPAVAEH
jgi:trimeric autotransporter adhesin